MIDLVCSTVPGGFDDTVCLSFKRDAFLAICDEEMARGLCKPALVERLRAEIVSKLG